MSPQTATLSKPSPTGLTLVGQLGRVSSNVALKVRATFRFMSTKGATKSDRILGVFKVKVTNLGSLCPIRFTTAGEPAWISGSFHRAVKIFHVSP